MRAENGKLKQAANKIKKLQIMKKKKTSTNKNVDVYFFS